MKAYKLTSTETKFAELIWANAPIGSMELVKLCEKEMGWKKSTTFTVLKTLCEKGIFKNEGAVVTAVITRESFLAIQSRRYVEDIFGGSLPKFVTSFIGGDKLPAGQLEELRRLIDEHEED